MPRTLQGQLPVMELQSVSQPNAVRTEVSQSSADVLAVVIDALDVAVPRITRKELAVCLEQSESLVSRKLAKESREQLGVDELTKFPERFWPAFHRLMGQRFGLRRAAVVRALEAVSDLALAVGD